MSSLTMCQHIFNSSEQEITTLLEKLGIPGIIIGKTETGITLVVEPEDSELIQQEVLCASMVYFGDAGFVLIVVDHGNEVGAVHYMWEAELQFHLSDNFAEKMVLANIIPESKIEQLETILAGANRHSFEPDDVNRFIDDITSLYGFAGYEYLSYDFLCSHEEDFKEQYPEMKFIDG